MLLDAANRLDDWYHGSLTKLIELGACYCVAVRPGFVAADFDGCDGQESADRYAMSLSSMGLTPVCLNSGGKGRAHVWCLIADPCLRSNARALIKPLGGDDRTESRIRPPFNPHRTGVAMSLRGGLTVASALAALDPKQVHVIEQPGAGQRSPGLIDDPKLIELLRTEGADRSRHAFRVVGYMKPRGYPVEAILQAILDHPEGAGHKYFYPRRKRVSEQVAMETARVDIYRSFEKVSGYRPARINSTVADRLDQIEFQALNHPWGPRKKGVQTMLLACIAYCQARVRLDFTMSQRSLQELCKIGQRTSGRRLKELITEGWIECTVQPTMLHSGTYVLLLRATQEYPRNDSLRDTPIKGACSIQVSHLMDVFSEAFVGRPSLGNLVLFILGMPDSFTVEQLGQAAGRSKKSTWQGLKNAEALGLVKPDGKYWVSTIDSEVLREAARCRGKENWLRNAKVTNQLARDAHRRFLEENLVP